MGTNIVEKATLGGGCFWCLDPIFHEMIGVEKVEVGYAGGAENNPSYESVCTGSTGHAEVVQVTFDPELVSYEGLLKVFFTVHDPTTLNRQGADVGTQYRSIVLTHDEAQRETADGLIESLEAEQIWGEPIVTEVVPYDGFYRAEEYHQGYFEKNPNQGYCQAIIAPKVAKFRTSNSNVLKVGTSRS